MDLLQEIQQTSRRISDSTVRKGIAAAVSHIAVAERHLDVARKDGDDRLYNDVIYRTNQAFEGVLKEAYRVFEGEPRGLSAYEVERYFAEAGVMAPRVMDQFKGYRQEWRNPATHDHTISFTEQEAVLGIVSVSAFARILLDQVVERLAADAERKTVTASGHDVRESIENYERMALCRKVAALMTIVSQDKHIFGTKVEPKHLHESEIMGRIMGFLSSVERDWVLEREKPIGGLVPLRPDLVVSEEDSAVVLEVKRRPAAWRGILEARAQIARYLQVSGLPCAVLFILPEHAERMMKVDREEVFGGGPGRLLIVKPDRTAELNAELGLGET